MFFLNPGSSSKFEGVYINSISLNPPGAIIPPLGFIENIFLSNIAFSKVSSSLGSPGSAQGSNSI